MENFKKISDIIDMPVFSEKSRSKIGKVSDVIFHPKNMAIIGYIVLPGGLIPIARFLSLPNVSKTEKGRLWVKDINSFSPMAAIKKNKLYVSFQRQAKGTDMSQNGRKIGKISDLLYRTEVGEIICFEVSDGFSEDILHGRKHINANNEIIFGNNNNEVLG